MNLYNKKCSPMKFIGEHFFEERFNNKYTVPITLPLNLFQFLSFKRKLKNNVL